MSSPEPANQSDAEAVTPPVNTKAVLIKAGTLLLVASLVAIVYQFTPFKEWVGKAGPLANWFRNLGTYGVVLFGLMSVVLIFVGVPRLLLCPVAGALYGFWGGLGVSVVSTMVSYYVAFLWVRGRRHKGLTRSELPTRLAFLAGDPGFSGVVIGRLMPVPGMLVTMTLSLSNVRDWNYLGGSAFGLIPEAVPAVLLGVMQDDLRKWGQLAAVALLVVIVGWLALHYLVKHHKKRA